MSAKVKAGFQKVAGAVGSLFAPLFANGRHRDEPYKMVLIGQTGSGKTSFLNLLCNCSLIQELGCEFDENAFAKLKNFHKLEFENPGSKKMESKTSGATLYDVKVGELKVGIIDTPGFGDSRGFDEDKKNVKTIINCLKAEEYVHCICLIINGRQARATPTLSYVLTQITAILPREVLNNVIVVFTNTDSILKLTFDAKSLQEYFGRALPRECKFCVENPYCTFENAKQRQDDYPIEEIAEALSESFQKTAKVLTKMCATMNTFEKIPTSSFENLYKMKVKIEEDVLKLVIAYDDGKKFDRLIKKAEEEVEAAVATKTLNKGFHSKLRGERTVVVKTSRHNTLCAYPNCTSNCHQPCTLPKSLDKEVFKRCACIEDDGKCNECGHDYTFHYHGESLYQIEEYTTNITDKVMKKKFEEAKSMEERKSILKKQHQDQRKKSEAYRKKLSEQVLLTIEGFQKLVVGRNYAKVIENQLAVINVRLEGEVGPHTDDLRKTQKELERILEVVEITLKEPWSKDADPKTRHTWACQILELNPEAPLMKDDVTKAYREACRISHPDKAGGDDESFKRVNLAKDILLKVSK